MCIRDSLGQGRRVHRGYLPAGAVACRPLKQGRHKGNDEDHPHRLQDSHLACIGPQIIGHQGHLLDAPRGRGQKGGFGVQLADGADADAHAQLSLIHILKIGVLVSGGGTNLQALLDAQKRGKIPDGEISLVIASRKKAYALERARMAGVPALALPRRDYENPADYDAALLTALQEAGVELVVLAGFLCVLGEKMLNCLLYTSAMGHHQESLGDTRCLVLGYGRCGKALCRALSGITRPWVWARRPEVRAQARAEGFFAPDTLEEGLRGAGVIFLSLIHI